MTYESSGRWQGKIAAATIARFFKTGAVPSPLPTIQGEDVWLTLLSLYILDTNFFDRQT